ncbi:MAG: DMT family transporter [Coprothermobacterota bacterium]|nr:DMT family transporter [Coprothermobacterota bacterium]
MAFTVVLWGNAFVAIRIGLVELSPLGLTLLRFLLASVSFLLVFLLTLRRVPLPRKSDLLPLGLMAILGGAGYHLLLNIGEQSVTAGSASLIIGATPIFTALWTPLFFRERLGFWQGIGILVAFGGLFLVSWKGSQGLGTSNWLGILAVLGAMLGWSFYPFLSRPLVARRGPLFVSAYTQFLALPLLLPWEGVGFYCSLPTLSPLVWGSVIFLALFCTVLGYIVFNRSLQVLGATATSSYLYLPPVVAVFFGWLLLGEPINIFLLFGAALVIGGVVLVNAAASRPAAKTESANQNLSR